MRKFTFYLFALCCFAFSWQGFAQSTINITTSGGSYSTEKWVSITTEVDGGGTLIWGQGDGTQCNGNGWINTDISIDPGTYYVNCYDTYDDGWDGTLITVTAYGNVLGDNGGVSPDDGEDTDVDYTCEGTPEELEASFVIVVPNPPACLAPLNLANTGVTATTADFSWTDNGAANGFNWVVLATNGDPDVDTPVTSGTEAFGDATASATGLTAATTYYFFVQADCGGDGTSAWTSGLEFTTACAEISTFPYLESFEGITSGQPDCWSIEGTTTTASYHFNSYSTGYSGRGMRFNSYYNSSGNTSELITPAIDASALPTLELKFYYKNPTAGNFEVLVSTDGGSNYTSLETGLTGQTPWAEKTYDLTSYISSTLMVKFKGISNYGSGDAYIYLDEVLFREIPSCPDITDLSNTGVTATTADFSWTDTGAANGYNWVVLATNGDPEVDTPVTSGTEAFGDVMASATGLTPATTYYFFVQADCGGGDTSTWTSGLEFVTDCVPYSATFSEGFETTSTGSSSNPTLPLCWSYIDGGTGYGYVSTTAVNTGANGYYMYSGYTEDPSLILVSPEVSDLTSGMQVRFSAADGYGYGGQVVFGTLSDPTDPLTFTAIQTIAPSSSHSEFTVFLPTTGTDSYFGFKILNQDTTYDYCYIYLDDIVYEPAPACIPVIALSNTGVTTTTADFSWTDTGASDGFNWVVLATNGTPGVDTPVTSGTEAFGDATASVTGLTSETTYYFFVQANCGGDGTSTWSSGLEFTTACDSVMTFPFFEDFEDDLSACWSTALVSGTTNWVRDPSGGSGDISAPYAGSGFMEKNYTSSDALFITPSFDLSGLSAGATIKVWLHRHGSAHANDQYKIYANTQANLTGATEIFSLYSDIDIAPTVASTGWYNYEIEIPSSFNASQSVYIIFEGITTAGYSSYDLGIDDFSIIDSTLSIEEVIDNGNLFTYYPNPVSNTLTLNAQRNIQSVSVMNMLGQEVLRATPNTVNSVLDMSNLTSGAYFVDVIVEGVSKTVRIIKN